MPRVGFKPNIPELQDRAATAMASLSSSTNILLFGQSLFPFLIQPNLMKNKIYIQVCLEVH